MSSVAAAVIAVAVIRVENGWVASTTAAVWWSRSHATSPSTPPKPPIRTSPSGSSGTATAPASDEVSAISGSRPTTAASLRASAVPPSSRTFTAAAAGRCP